MIYDIYTVFWRDWQVLKHRLLKFIVSRMVAPILYMVAFGWGLGRSISVDSGTYLDFLVPGILALNSMNIAFNSLTPVHTEKVYHRSLESYLIAPINIMAFPIGKILSALLRSLISSLIIIVLAYSFGANFKIDIWFIFILSLNSIIFAEIGFVAAMTVKTFEDMARYNTYILLPMSFLCGTFFKTTNLPFFLKEFIEILPLTHTAHLLRSLSTGESINLISLAILLFYAIFMLYFCYKTMKKAMQ